MYGNESPLKNKLRVLFYKAANEILLYERRAKDLLIKEGLKEENLKVIFNSLDYDVHKELRTSEDLRTSNKPTFFINNDLPYLIFVGRLTKVKKNDLLIKSVQQINKEAQKVNLLIVGDGVEKENLETLTKELDLEDQVHLYGACYKEELLAQFIYHATLCVSPGNVGLTAMHSLSFGTPVCTHQNYLNQMPEVEVIEEGFNGCFFDENNIEDLTKVIDNWLGNSVSREQIRKQCYQVIDTYYNPYYQYKIIKSLL